MDIYNSTSYRKIYIKNYGPIPEGYEIHHIDGNHNNNEPSNLKAVTIQEHYNIHYSQGDYAACILIQKRMDNPPNKEELSKISSVSNRIRIENGTHNWLGPESNRKRIENGTHNWLNCNKGEDNPAYDHSIYTFKHKSGETYTGTRWNFYKKYNLHKGNVGQMIKGNTKFKSVKGWSVL